MAFYVYDYYYSFDEISEESTQEIHSGFNLLPTSTTGQIVKHHYYTLSYYEKYEQAEWVAYALTKKQVLKTHFKRPYF